MTGSADVIDKGNAEGAKKRELEENVRTADIWRAAVRKGNYAGADCLAIGGLLKFLDAQYESNLAEYEALAVKHPDWWRPAHMPAKK